MSPVGSLRDRDSVNRVMLDQTRPTVSVIIKALNEEDHIAGAIESALAATVGMNAEIILADSLSTDRTIEIAKAYPIRILSLSRSEDRSCGVGPQLGYQYSRGDYVCLIDGDMRLYGDFLRAALECLDRNPKLAGVGGIIVEREEENLEYVKRASRDDPDRRPGLVTRLDCGGVYRRAAIEVGRILLRPQSARRRGVRSRRAPACARLGAGPDRPSGDRPLRSPGKRLHAADATRLVARRARRR